MVPLVLIAVLLLALTVTLVQLFKPKKFGLKEAEAAMRYTGDNPETARAVKGVVVGVLQYEDAVASEVEAAVAEADEEIAEREEVAKAYEEQIRALETKIAAMEAESREDDARTETVRHVGNLFA